jgi:hypothetical protein
MALGLLKPTTMVTNPDIYLNDKLLCRAISGLIPIVVFFAGFISEFRSPSEIGIIAA